MSDLVNDIIRIEPKSTFSIRKSYGHICSPHYYTSSRRTDLWNEGRQSADKKRGLRAPKRLS